MGIPIKIHISFLLILPLFVFVFSINPYPLGFSEITPNILNYVLSFLTAIFLFICVLLHELAHSYVAMKYGVKISDITLLLIGGVSSMEEVPREPSQEAAMAFAGPLVSIIIGFTLLLLNWILVTLIPSIEGGALYTFLFILGFINVILGIFNLIPAFPMDGGRLLRAWYANKMNYVKATEQAASVGKMFAIFMGLFGLLINPWLIIIALFVYIGASEEAKSTTTSISLENIKAKDIMSENLISVPSSFNLEELQKFMLEKKHMGYLVSENNEFIGVVTLTDVKKIHPTERIAFKVIDIMTPDVITIPSDANASEAIKLMSSKQIGRVFVVEDGSIVGVLSRTDLIRALTFLKE
ncbi:CBS domain-containing protein [Methanosalsum natronophilum]|nr:CBS domain-containing protein [Methanosalsum natronophilum]MCS3923947.1 Zn-dependent protease/predicted transcriptional regulator [Methanosalsum natronophilum]